LTAGLLILARIGFGQSLVPGGGQGESPAVRFQVLDQKIVFFGQHSITFNRVAPPVFPAPVSTPAPTPPAQLGQSFANCLFLFLSATVYDGQLTVIQWSCGDQEMVAVSNINFNYLATLDDFTEGNTFCELTAFVDNESSAEADPATAAWLAQARGALPAGAPGYVIVSGTGGADVIQGLDALHAYFAANESALIQASTQRQAQYAAQLLHEKLYPPARPDTVVNYWPIKSSVYLTGSEQ